MRRLQQMLFLAMPINAIAAELGCDRRTISRYLQQQRTRLSEELRNQQEQGRRQLIEDSVRDLARLDRLIVELEASQDRETTAGNRIEALKARNQIRRSVARLIDAETPSKHLHVHAQNGGYAPQKVQSGPVNIIFETYGPGDPGYDPSFVPGHRIGKPIDVEAERTEDR